MFKELFADDNERGVSPVIGVILMVAITVILAAVIGAFVLGLGDQVSETAPTATIDYEFDNADGVTLSHEGGAELDNSTISININGSVAPTTGWDGNDDDMISAGDTITLESSSALYGDVESDDFASGNTVRVIWQGDSGSSSTIASRDFP
jgi:flagellin-like protein